MKNEHEKNNKPTLTYGLIKLLNTQSRRMLANSNVDFAVSNGYWYNYII